jgi:replicative DNA helicase
MMSFEDDRRTRAEQRLLGALLIDAGAIRHCETVKPADFSHDLHGAIFATIRHLIADDRAVNAVSVLGLMKLQYRAPRFDVFPYLLTLLAQGAVPAHAGYYAAIMCEKGQPR